MKTDSQLIGHRIRTRREELGMTQSDLGDAIGVHKSTIMRYEAGEIARIKLPLLQEIARKLDVSPDWLALKTDNTGKYPSTSRGAYGFPAPQISDDVVTMPVIGDMAAGFEHIAAENWSGDTICIPESYLHGRPASDYIVLNVCGDSMYPFYLDGDKVLVLRTPALEYSGQVALVRYDGEMATLKKVEYHPGDDKMKLIPANPLYQPREITGSDLDQCSIIGIPKLVIREV